MSASNYSLANLGTSGSRSDQNASQLRAPSTQYYCPFCDEPVFTYLASIKTKLSKKTVVGCCMNCNEIIRSVVAPRLVGIELNPGPPSRRSKRRMGRRNNNLRTIKPPQHKSNIVVNHTYRFTSSASGSHTITGLDIAGAIGGICTVSNSTLVCYAESFKIKKVEAWSTINLANNLPASVSVEWLGSGTSSNMEISDTSVSTANPAYITTKPPKESTSSFWQNPASNNNNLFIITQNNPTIVDIQLEYILADENVTSLTIATGTLGDTYYLALDGPTTNVFTPVSLTTTH
jgi:hypothetical protein